MKKVKLIVSIIILLMLIPIIVIGGVITVDSWIHPDEVPSFFGWKPFIVLSGSMEAEIFAGDIAVVKEVDTKTLKKDDIIAFRSDEVVVTHRIIDVIEENGERKFATKGDNNNTEDNGYVLENEVEGLYQFKVSRVGNLAMFIQTPTGMIVALSIPVILLIIVQTIDRRKERKLMEEKFNNQKSMEEEIEKLKKQNEELRKH